MPALVTRAQLISDVRLRANMVNSTFVTDDEVGRYVDQAVKSLYDKLIAARGQEYYSTDAFPLVPTLLSTNQYVLPDDFYQLLVVVNIDSGTRYTLAPYALQNAADIANQNYVGPGGYQYRLWGAQGSAGSPPVDLIRILPVPPSPLQIFIAYIPVCTTIETTGEGEGTPATYFNGVNGWEEYAIWQAVATCLAKEESDPTFALSMVALQQQRIDGLAYARDAGRPEQIVDTRRDRYDLDGIPRARWGWYP